MDGITLDRYGNIISFETNTNFHKIVSLNLLGPENFQILGELRSRLTDS